MADFVNTVAGGFMALASGFLPHIEADAIAKAPDLANKFAGISSSALGINQSTKPDTTGISKGLKTAFGAVCINGEVKPEIYSLLASNDQLGDIAGKALVGISDGLEKPLAGQAISKMPYLTSVVESSVTQIGEVLHQEPSFDKYVSELRAETGATPRERLLSTMGGLESMCRMEGRITGAFTDAMNGIDWKKASPEIKALLEMNSARPVLNFGR